MKKILTFAAILLFSVNALNAQELQFQYDFARSKVASEPYMTLCVTNTGFDKLGSTFFFVDFDFAKTSPDKVVYGEIQRSINLWQNTALKDFCLEVEYDGGVLPAANMVISQAFLTGVAYAFHDKTYQNFFQLQALYRKFFGNTYGDPTQKIPLQFTAVWVCKDLFGLKGLLFSGFADFWWQDREIAGDPTTTIFTTEPQLWYNIGHLFGVDNLHIGGEVEVSLNAYSFDKHFTAYPAAGIKWVL